MSKTDVCLNLDFHIFKYCRHLQTPRKVQYNQAKTGRKSWKLEDKMPPADDLLPFIYAQTGSNRGRNRSLQRLTQLRREVQTGSGVSLCCAVLGVTLITGVRRPLSGSPGDVCAHHPFPFKVPAKCDGWKMSELSSARAQIQSDTSRICETKMFSLMYIASIQTVGKAITHECIDSQSTDCRQSINATRRDNEYQLINMCERVSIVCVHALTLAFNKEHHHAQEQCQRF